MSKSEFITGFRIDLEKKQINPARIEIAAGRIKSIVPADAKDCQQYILPGFLDAHVHIESSLMIPSEFARMAVVHGTVGTISDPHEIANVMGVFGVEYMLRNAAKVPFHFHFGAPSCVPATEFETAGDQIDAKGVDYLMQRDDIWYLAEVMNFPGVLAGDEELLKKIDSARKLGKPVDGHAPGLRGKEAAAYAAAGITTDHECFTLPEALDKIEAGMKIQIREGSAARNFDALHTLLTTHPDKVMFCSDDKHPDSLLEGHINLLVLRALQLGHDLFDVLNAASKNIRDHYNLPVGMLQEGDRADFIVINNTIDFEILATYINGIKVAGNGKTLIHSVAEEAENRFNKREVGLEEFFVPAAAGKVKVIEALDGQLITNCISESPLVDERGNCVSDTKRDILKLAVVNRYRQAPPALAFIKNLGLKKGAIASSVAHDSHNIVVAGCNDEDMRRAVELLMKTSGGLCAVCGEEDHVLPLPVAGLMSTSDAWEICETYYSTRSIREAKSWKPVGRLYETLVFMALLVIPSIKTINRGLFDGDRFCFTDLSES
ncbi:MAG: adenine deaminase [Bacteroidia bacterium]